MRIFAPDYYDQFNCIADKCSFTCCRDWKITVDDNTLGVWKKTPMPLSMGMAEGMLSDYVCRDFGGDKIKLCEDGKCPFLNEQGLCHIVKQYGEQMISVTCHTFPREEHVFSDRIEKTLTMGCPAALELLWQKKKISILELTPEQSDSDYSDVSGRDLSFEPEADEALILFRDKSIELMSNNELSVSEALKVIFFLALDCYDREETGEFDVEYVEAIFGPKVLTDVVKAVRGVERDPCDSVSERNELFLDLAENYRKKKIYADVLEAMATLAEEYEDEEDSYEKAEVLLEAEEIMNAECTGLEKKIRILMAEELYSTLVLPGGDLESLVIKLEWLGIFYAVLCAMLVLRWKQKKNLLEADVTEIVTVLVRMTGYSDEDIEEYLEASFEELIWDWGYMDLIVS